MAITDYDTLVATLKRTCARSDSTFSAAIPDFIAMAEERIYNGHGDPDKDPMYSAPLRAKVLEATGTITVTDGTGTVPSDYLAMRKIFRAGDTDGMTFMPQERFAVEAANGQPGTPVYYTFEGTDIKVYPTWTGDLTVSHYKRHPEITNSNKTGPLIEQHGLVYLQACLIEAFAWMQETELALGYATKLRGMINGINRTASDLRTAGAMRARPRVFIP